VAKIIYSSGTLGSKYPIHTMYRLSGTFTKNDSGIIPLISENQESHGSTGF